MKSWIVCLLVMATVAWSFEASALRFEGTERQITTDPSEQTDPSISGSVIVWTDRRNGNIDIYMYDLETATETAITNDPAPQYLNDVSGNIAVYTDYYPGNEDVMAYDIAREVATNLTSHPANQRQPAISGSVVVFQDDRNRAGVDLWDLYLVNIAGGEAVPLVLGNGTQVNADINGNVVVWEDLRNGVDLDVYMKNIATGEERLVAGGPGNQRYPHVSGDLIVYNNGSDDIWAYRISTGENFAITSSEAMERIPVVSGDLVAFERLDPVDGDMDIWIFSLSLGAEIQATIDPADQFLQDLDGNRLVYTDSRNGNLDIYLFEFILDEPPVGEGCNDPQAVTVFGPKVYVRGYGKPQTIIDAFVGLQLGGSAYLCITNGNPDGSQKVTSALVSLNGRQVARPNDFGEDVDSIEKPIELLNANILTVQNRGAPGSRFSLRIVEIAPPEDGTIVICCSQAQEGKIGFFVLVLLGMVFIRRRGK